MSQTRVFWLGLQTEIILELDQSLLVRVQTEIILELDQSLLFRITDRNNP